MVIDTDRLERDAQRERERKREEEEGYRPKLFSRSVRAIDRYKR